MSRAFDPSQISGEGVTWASNRLVVARGGVGIFSEVRAGRPTVDREGGLSQGPPYFVFDENQRRGWLTVPISQRLSFVVTRLLFLQPALGAKLVDLVEHPPRQRSARRWIFRNAAAAGFHRPDYREQNKTTPTIRDQNITRTRCKPPSLAGGRFSTAIRNGALTSAAPSAHYTRGRRPTSTRHSGSNPLRLV